MSDKFGIPCCVNCVGMHPDEVVTYMEIKNRLKNPNKVVAAKMMSFDKKRLTLYANKSCMLCGRTYKANGEPDETWELTAQRIQLEFQKEGITLDFSDIRKVVASCRKSWELLLKNRASINVHDWDKMTFSGRLALILTHALDAREKRNTLNGGSSLTKGILDFK